MGEAELLVQRDGGGIACPDGAHHHMFARGPRGVDQRLHERPTHAAAARFRCEMDGMLHRQTITREGPEVTETGISQHAALFLRHQNRIALSAAGGEPLGAIFCIHRGIVPDGICGGQDVIIDFRQSRQVGGSRLAEDHRVSLS